MDLNEKTKLWMKRFHGRRDVYGQIYTMIVTGKKKPEKRVNPVYVEKYRDKNLRQATEFNSPEELFMPLTEDVVEAHLDGRMEVMTYLPRRDNTTSFFAIDFDFQHGFRITQEVSRALSTHQIPHAIARSTTKGHHIYAFFDQTIQSFYIHNYLDRVFEELGYMDKLDNDEVVGTKPNGDPILWTNPEIFPKVISVGDSVRNIGNGIKTAMHGKAVENNQCCFVDINNNVIGGKGTSAKQWEYFRDIPEYSVEAFKKLIDGLGIEVDEDLRLSEKRGRTSVSESTRSIPYVAPGDGDFRLIIDGCPALKRQWEKPIKDVPNHARVSLLAMALKCKNGLEYIRDKFGDTPETNYQINWAMENNQQPWTCKRLQDYDICLKGKDPVNATGRSTDKEGKIINDYCFEKSPPRQMVNGKLIINPNQIPEKDWPLPSPVRKRLPPRKKIAEKLAIEIDKLNRDDQHLREKVSKIVTDVVNECNKKERKTLLSLITKKKLVSKSEIEDIVHEAAKDKKQIIKSKLESSCNIRLSNGLSYIENGGGGYSLVKIGSDDEISYIPISNFSIIFKKDKRFTPLVGDSERYFSGIIICKGKTFKFEISAEDYSNKSKFSKRIFTTLGPQAQFHYNQIELILAAVSVFGLDEMETFEVSEEYGYDCNVKPSIFRTTSGIITKDGFKKDSRKLVELNALQFASQLNLISMTDTEFKSVARSIIDNVMLMREPHVTMTGIAHSVQALIHNPYIPINTSPILWIQGLTGVGKSFFAKALQFFHGDFQTLCSVQTTHRAIDQYTMYFKDALLVLDDFKRNGEASQNIVDLIQKIYDRSERGRLSSDLKQSKTISARGLVLFTGEDPPSDEASIYSRLIYLEVNELLSNSVEEKENLQKIISNWEMYSGVSMRFVQYMLEKYLDPKKLHQKFFDDRSVIGRGIIPVQNSPRIIDNLTANYFTWELFLSFLLDKDVISREEFEEFREVHFKNIKKLRDKMLCLCSEGQGSEKFLSLLEQAINSGKYYIDSQSHAESYYSKGEKVGFFESPSSDIVYVYPDIAMKAVNSLAENRFAIPSKQSISKQLFDEGILAQTNDKTRSYKKRDSTGKARSTWCIDLLKAGILGRGNDSQKEEGKEMFLPIDEM